MLRWLALPLLLAGASAEAQTRGWFPRKTGECGWVHGRYAVYNGSGVRRIRVIDSTHLLNLYDDDETVPSELDIDERGHWKVSGERAFDAAIYGDFFVCARERYRRGHMQHVRIRRTKNLVSGPYRL